MPDKPPSFIPDSFIPDKVAQPSSTFFHSDAIHGGIADPTIGWGEKLSNLAFGRNDPSITGPGMMKIPGMESAGDWIRNKAINSGNYYVGAGGSLLGDLLSDASTGFDPRAVALKGSEFKAPLQEVPKYDPAVLGAQDATGSASVYQPVPNQPILKQLGPATTNLESTAGIPTGELPPQQMQLPPSFMSDDAMLGTGKPAELLHPNSMMPASELPKPALDVQNAQPRIPATPEDINKIPPGQPDVPPLIGKDMSPVRAEVTSPHIVMKNWPVSSDVIQPIMGSYDEKMKWLATTMRDFADAGKGVDPHELMAMLNGDMPMDARASRASELLDDVWRKAQDSNPTMGFIDRYITHIQKQPDDIRSAITSIIDNQFGKNSGLYKVFSSGESGAPTGDIGDFFNRGKGAPESPFTKYRAGIIPEIETNYNKIMPVYLESMAKSIFDKPAVIQSTQALKNIPAGKLKEYLTGYIQNYSRYDADAQLANAWSSLANQIGTINARSVIPFNPVVHMYHAGQLPANVWPELGTKYSLIGMRDFLSNPAQSYQELAKNGMFSSMIRPMQFQTAMQKFDSIGYYINMVESIVKGTGYYGFKARALDQGLSDLDATMRAISETKNATATVDPSRSMRLFTPESNVMGGQMAALSKQYHQIPYKIVEQFATAASDFKNDPQKAARYLAGNAIAAAGAAAGLHTMHINPTNMLITGAGQFATTMGYVMRDLAKGDPAAALGQVATWLMPAGTMIKKLMQ